MTTRFEKLEYLLESCGEGFIKDCDFLRELVDWMSEDEFDKFYDRLCRTYDIPKDYEELSKAIEGPSEEELEAERKEAYMDNFPQEVKDVFGDMPYNL